MTELEKVSKLREIYSAKFDILQKEFEIETNTLKRVSKITEMIDLADAIAVLDTKKRTLIMVDYQQKINEAIEEIIE